MDDAERILETLLHQELMLQFDNFSNETACAVGMALVERAKSEGKAVTVDVRRHGQQLFHFALPGTSPDNDQWLVRKERVVRRFGHSSFYMGQRYASRHTTIEESALLDPRRYAAHGGAFPAIVRGTGPVGVIAVSGLPQDEDHELVVRTLAEFLNVTLEN
jgi:uncharacterized protein (UPF0303 family)